MTKNQNALGMATGRAILLGLILMPFNAFWVVKMEVTRYAGHPTTISLFFNVIFWLTALIGVNALVRRFLPRFAFSPGELLTIYLMLALGSAVAGHDTIEVLTPILAHADNFADGANSWAERALPYLPSFLHVSNKQALKEFYQGTGTLYSAPNLAAWMIPVLCWTGLLTLLGCLMLCLNVILRRQWTESEKLAYPLVTLPLEMVNPRTALFSDRVFWIGVLLSAAMEAWNGLAFLYPSLPMLPLRMANGGQDLSAYLTHPWNAIGWTPMTLYPFGIALGMLLPVDLLFSSWFFAWVWRAERVVGVMYSWDGMPDFPYVESQALGAFLGVAAFALWASRRHFGEIFDALFDREIDLRDANEPLPYRVAAWGLLLGTAALFAFCRLCGMGYGVIAAFFGVYFLIAIAITRMRAELGPPAHDLHMSGPDTMLPKLVGPHAFSRTELGMFSLFYGFNRAYRGHPMPIQLEGFKMGEQLGQGKNGGYKSLAGVMILALFFGAICGFWANLDQGYRFGAGARIGPPNVMLIFGSEPWNRYNGWLAQGPRPQEQLHHSVAIAVGFAFTLLLNALRVRFAGFPFHPVGYAISSSWSLGLLWMPLLIAWTIKSLLLKYGGLRAYRRALPFFLGLILGECILGSLWTLIGIGLDFPTYSFWP